VSRRRYRYTGKERDEETGLYYHGARYYAPWLGRWTAADPAGLVDGINRYTYTHDNPVIYFDPTGAQRKHHGDKGWPPPIPMPKLPSSDELAMRLFLFIACKTCRDQTVDKQVDDHKRMGAEALKMADEAVASLQHAAQHPEEVIAEKTKERLSAVVDAYTNAGGGVEGVRNGVNQLNPLFLVPDALSKSTIAAADAANKGDPEGFVRNGLPVLLFVGGTLQGELGPPSASDPRIVPRVNSNGSATLPQAIPVAVPGGGAAAGGALLATGSSDGESKQKKTPSKAEEQIKKAQLPQSGEHVFEPKLVRNKRGELVIDKRAVEFGPRAGKVGYVDTEGRIWIRGEAHGNIPEHWDVQMDGGKSYMNVGLNGEYEPRIKK
jgi:RHS repeat-associated protein